jgi:pimeloyl-ACP methyl ester carboxylesterase
MQLFVRERGDGFPLLLINGIGASAELWRAAEDRLSARSRTIVFDAPGTGRSSTPSLPLTMADLAAIAARVLDELGYEQVDVIGFSFGGCVAQELVRAHPERVRRLALVSTMCGWGAVPGEPAALALVATPLRYLSRTLYESTDWLLVDPDRRISRRLKERRLRYPPSVVGYTYQLWAGMAWSSLPWVHRLQVPTLVVGGELDRLAPVANAMQLAALIPQSRLHVFAKDGHLLLFDRDSAVHELLADFFASPTLDESQAWTSGTSVDDTAARDALRKAPGAEPFRALSSAFRWLVDSGRAA